MPKVSFDDFELYYEVHGSGSPVLLVSGLGGVGSYWQEQVPEFSKHFQVILHDHRGTGRSSRSRIEYSIEQMTSDLVKLMDALEVERAHLVGHSTGGAIGQIMAIEHPERLISLVLNSSWTKADPFRQRVAAVRKDLVLKCGVAAYVKATPLFLYPSWWISDNSERLEREEQQALASFPPAEIAASRLDAGLAFNRTAELGRIQTPTLVICAKDDGLTPAYFSEQLAKMIPTAKLVLLERGGHASAQTIPDEFNQFTLSFLLDHEIREP